MRKSLLAATIGGFLMVTAIGTPASAAPLGAGALAAATETSTGMIEKVHRRSYRHCHWRGGHRWCHGPHFGGFGYYGYGYWPRHRHWRHHHRHHRHGHHHHRRHRR